MKLNFARDHGRHVKKLALEGVNRSIRDARRQILRTLPLPKQRWFVRGIKAARVRVFEEEGFRIPMDADAFGYEERHQRYKELRMEDKIALQKQMSVEIRALAEQLGLTHLVELETLRQLQLDAVALSAVDEDARAVQQLTRDLADNVVRTHEKKFTDRVKR